MMTQQKICMVFFQQFLEIVKMADQTKRILYMQDSGVIAVICPALKETRTVEEIAKKRCAHRKKI